MKPEGVLDEIKSRLDIIEVISDYVPLRKLGQNYRGLCPFHSEKTPSFMVSQQKQIFHCFGCSIGGDVVGFVMRYENLSFGETLRLLAKRAGVRLDEYQYRESGEKAVLKEIQREALKFFKEGLENAKTAKAYLENRGLKETTIEEFSLGYAPRGGIYEYLKGKGYKDPQILQSGLVSQGQSGLYDTFRERVIFPISDTHGDVIAFGGRTMADAVPKYLNSPDTPLFKKSEILYALNKAMQGIRGNGCVIVVEGYLDAIMSHQSGLGNTVAPLGTALTVGHLKRLGRFTSNILLVFDGDNAGRAAARRTLPLIIEHAMRAQVLVLPDGYDPDSLLREKGPEHLKALLSKTVSPVEFLLKSSTQGKTETVKEALSVIAKAGDLIFREELISELSDRAKIREPILRDELKKSFKLGQDKPVCRSIGTGRKEMAKPATLSAEHLLLSVMLSLPEKADGILKEVSLDDIKDKLVREVIRGVAFPGGRAAPQSDEENALIRRLTLLPGFDPSEADRVISDCIRKIKRQKLNEWIAEAESKGDMRLLNRLTNEEAERGRLLEEQREERP